MEQETVLEREGEWEWVEWETILRGRVVGDNSEREGEWERVERETVHDRKGEWERV